MGTTANTSSPTTNPHQHDAPGRDQRAHKQRMAKLRRRRRTLIKKVDEFHTLCGAEMYMVIHMNGRFYEYSSTKNPCWPPQRADISRQYPVPEVHGPEGTDDTHSLGGQTGGSAGKK